MLCPQLSNPLLVKLFFRLQSLHLPHGMRLGGAFFARAARVLCERLDLVFILPGDLFCQRVGKTGKM